MFLSLPDHVKRKTTIICDEASELEEELIKQFSAEIQYEKLEHYGINHTKLITDNKEKARIWIYKLIEKLDSAIESLSKAATTELNLLSKVDRIKLQYLKNLHHSLTTIDSTWSGSDYVIDVEAKRVQFTPLHANSLSKHIFDHAEKVVLMSATIIDHKHFAKSLGITDYAYIEAESDFDSSKSPIYVSSAHKLNYKTLKATLPKICDQIKDIIEHHKDEKGIIHTHTQEITNYIQTKLGYNSRFLFRDEFANNEQILKAHKQSKEPTILVSPSLAFGVDLKDELARFQIIVKLPFFPLSSKRVKYLFEQDKDWYENKMLNAVVQASGRATRSAKDYSVTYILDATFVNTIKRSKNKLPKHFIDRIH
jgi:Rad3-related DNA helicase